VHKPVVDDDMKCNTVLRKLVMEQLNKPIQKATEEAGTASRAPQVEEALGGALVALGLRSNHARVDLGISGATLSLRFEGLSRWKGASRGTQCPPSRPMTGPSPVTALATLMSSIVAGHEDGNVFVWDSTGKSRLPLHQFQAHRVPVSAIAVLGSLGLVVTVGSPKTREQAHSDSLLRVWSCVTLELQQTVSFHGSTARCLCQLDAGCDLVSVVNTLDLVGDDVDAREEWFERTVVPPCLVVGVDSSSSRQLQLMKIDLR